VIAVVVVLTAVANTAALVLLGFMFWTAVVLGRPVSPGAQGLLLVVMGSMSVAFALMRFARASAKRHPRWQRAYGVMFLLFAGYLLVQGIRML
jgi:hypothetical protein